MLQYSKYVNSILNKKKKEKGKERERAREKETPIKVKIGKQIFLSVQ